MKRIKRALEDIQDNQTPTEGNGEPKRTPAEDVAWNRTPKESIEDRTLAEHSTRSERSDDLKRTKLSQKNLKRSENDHKELVAEGQRPKETHKRIA